MRVWLKGLLCTVAGASAWQCYAWDVTVTLESCLIHLGFLPISPPWSKQGAACVRGRELWSHVVKPKPISYGTPMCFVIMQVRGCESRAELVMWMSWQHKEWPRSQGTLQASVPFKVSFFCGVTEQVAALLPIPLIKITGHAQNRAGHAIRALPVTHCCYHYFQVDVLLCVCNCLWHVQVHLCNRLEY